MKNLNLEKKPIKSDLELNLSGQKFSDWKFLSEYELLEKLDLSDSNIKDNSILIVKNLKNIHVLDISDTTITDLSFLEGLIKLEKLNISGTNINDIKSVENLINLKYFCAHDTQIKHLWPLSKLYQLQVIKMERAQITGVDTLADLKNLRELDLYGNENLSYIGSFPQLNKLEKLCIKGTGINDPNQLSSLEKLRSLKELIVNNNIEFAAQAVLNYIKETFSNNSNTVNFGRQSSPLHKNQVTVGKQKIIKDPEISKAQGCYVVVIEGTPHQTFDIDSFFQGEDDKFYAGKNSGQPSVLFDILKIFHDLPNAILYARNRRIIARQAYALYCPLGEKELRKMVGEGKFSRAIEKAIDCKQIDENKKFEEKDFVINNNFDRTFSCV